MTEEALERMKKMWIAGMAFVLAVALPSVARARHHSVTHWSDDDGGGSFSAATLTGTYVFEVNGFADDGKPGEVAVLGTLTFDGTSAVTGNLILSHGNNSQDACNDTFTTGTYSLTSAGPPGFYAMKIPMNSGSINFGLLVPRADGNKALAIEADAGALSVNPCSTSSTIVSMSLKGKLRRLDEDSDDWH